MLEILLENEILVGLNSPIQQILYFLNSLLWSGKAAVIYPGYTMMSHLCPHRADVYIR